MQFPGGTQRELLPKAWKMKHAEWTRGARGDGRDDFVAHGDAMLEPDL